LLNKSLTAVLIENKSVLQGELKACNTKVKAVAKMPDKKLIAYSLIAVILGVATIVPLGFFLTTQLDKEPQFNIDIPYAYIDNYWDNDTSKIDSNYGWVYGIIIETQPKNNLKEFPFNIFPYADAIAEYYKIEVSSEKGSIGNFSYSVDEYTIDALRSGFRFERDIFLRNEPQNYGTAGKVNGTSIGYINGATQNLDTSLGKPDSLTLTVRREGWAVLKNNATTVHLADSEVIVQLEFEKYGAGFLSNQLFTQDQMSRINPVMPQYEVL